MSFISGIIDSISSGLKSGAASLPVLIGVILAIAFIAMLLVTIFTLVTIKRAEIKAKKVIDIPPSALKGGVEQDSKIKIPEAPSSVPWPIGEWLNNYLIQNGYIRANSIIRSFFKSLDFLKNSLGKGYKYKLPWYMIIGSEKSGKTSLMSGFTHDEIYDDEGDESQCMWWFLKSGVVLDIKGSIFFSKGEDHTDDKSWNIILNMLARYRSEKPLNGMILTIPADELYGKNKLSIEDIKRRAEYIGRKLNFAQSYLGMKLPVYVVVTKTDIVPGFQSFCSEIPVRNRGNMLGWSTPYSLDIPYSPRMIDEGFVSFENELNELRIEIFSGGTSISTRDGIFVFPSELLTVKPLLKIYIDTIFRTASIEERFFFRGFYFTGDSKMMPLLSFDGENSSEPDAMAILGTPDANINEVGSFSLSIDEDQATARKIFFFEDLLLKKIFLEDGIASPMKSKIQQSNKSITIAKISTAAFVLIGSYGLFNVYDNLKASKNMVYPSLFKLSSLIKHAGDLTYRNLEENGNEILGECTNQLLFMMQQLNNARFSSLFVPASWFSSINDELTETLRISYQRVIVRTIYMNLILKSREILTMKPEQSSTTISQLLNPQNSVEYANLKRYVFGLIELEKNIKKFDSLRTSGDPKDLNDLVDYTFQGTLPREFLDNYQQFRSILMNTPFPPINLSPYKKVAYNVLLGLFQSYLDSIFTTRSENSIISYLTRFVSQLSRQNLKDVPDVSSLIKFSRDLSTVCKELGSEGETWLDKDIFEPDSEFDALLDGVEILFGKETAQKLLDIVAINFGYLKSNLAKFNASLDNDISSRPKVQKGDETFPSSGIYRIEKCLANLCAEPFMGPSGDYQLITEIPEGKMIFWDDELIRYAYEIGKSYEQFMATGIKDFPRGMQEGISLVAKTNLCAVIASTIAKAQSLVDNPTGISDEITSEEILQKQVTELKGVSQRFISLLKILRDDKFGFVFGNLRSVLNRVGYSLLTHLDRLLENQRPYYPNNLSFDYWDGKSGAGYQAFASSDQEELVLFLKLQRSMVIRLAHDFAEPIVDFLNSDVIYDKNYGDRAQLSKWSRIVDSVRGLSKKDPTNSVTAIENFIVATLNTYDLDNITGKISMKDLRSSSGDYFLDIITKIKKGIMAKAEVLIRKRNISRYNSLRDYYNKHLEGKYPFSNYDKSKRTSVDADLDAVREFFRMYDSFGGTPESILDQIYQIGGVANVPYNFLKKIHDLRLFLGDFINNQYETLKVSLEANFEVNKREEKNTDYLIDRIFKPNNDSDIEPITSDKSGAWYFGSPIELNLKWVREDDQADRPVYDQNDPDLILEDNGAKFQCVGNWSVLRFLQKYKTDLISSDQLSPNQIVLGFKVPLSTGKIAKFYLGVTMSTPKKPGDPSVFTLKLPVSPEKMPEMPQDITSISDVPVLSKGEQSFGNSMSFGTSMDVKPVDNSILSNRRDTNKASLENADKKQDKPSNNTVKSVEPTVSQEEIQDKKEAIEILNSDEPVTEEDSVIEVSQEPIS